MNRQLTQDELSKLNVPTMLPMSRREKLLRWAEIVRHAPQSFHIYHRLEYLPLDGLRKVAVGPTTAFAAAAIDPILRDAGLTGGTFGDAMDFFELSQADLHEFSCDCGGEITNRQMADRIENLANRDQPKTAGFRIVNGIKRAVGR